MQVYEFFNYFLIHLVTVTKRIFRSSSFKASKAEQHFVDNFFATLMILKAVFVNSLEHFFDEISALKVSSFS
jgi:hypothetical protein